MFTHVVIVVICPYVFICTLHCIQAYHIITLSFFTIYSTSPIEAPVHWEKNATSCQSYGRAMAKLYREAGHVVDAYLKILRKLNMGRLAEFFSGWALGLGVGDVEFGSFSI